MGVGGWEIFKKVATQIIQEVSGREKQVKTTEDKSVTRFTGRNPENKTEGKRLWAGLMMGFSNKQESKTRIKGECPAERKTQLQGWYVHGAWVPNFKTGKADFLTRI